MGMGMILGARRQICGRQGPFVPFRQDEKIKVDKWQRPREKIRSCEPSAKLKKRHTNIDLLRGRRLPMEIETGKKKETEKGRKPRKPTIRNMS